ncbi:hypothetical protein KIW84_014984 [Lathyrus oleraceus]|uniref:Uncharacterized protein n=1 Tax=Pisum sativum TaxID=3888 RepID=A0A9D5GZR8_PEA|nr:hypothetical protein KIW84_014984 [Pisum sativum]
MPSYNSLIQQNPFVQTILLRINASSKSDNAQSPNWSKWIPAGSFVADKVFRLTFSATASPIGQFVSSPTMFLHSINPRVKLVTKIHSCMAFRSGCSTDKVAYNYAIWISSILDFAFSLDSTKKCLDGKELLILGLFSVRFP